MAGMPPAIQSIRLKYVEPGRVSIDDPVELQVVSRGSTPHNSAVLARDQVQIGLAENGGDSTQDGCAFHVSDVEALFGEFKANGLHKELSEFDIEQHDNVAWKVFYVVAPDGLCYWFGERQPG
jgi:lactoylglutathione lyase